MPIAIDATSQWAALADHAVALTDTTIADLFEADPGRAEALTVDGAGLHVDFSKNRITTETRDLLIALADAAGVADHRDAMFRGDRINTTEDRSVLHTALRLPREATLVVDGVDVVDEVHQVLDRMAAFADSVRDGSWTGATGKPIRAVVNIGIGGSDLGPAMAYQALQSFAEPGTAFRFVSNIDPADIHRVMVDFDPETTLFVVVSKTFGTIETLTNAESAKEWIVDELGAAAVSRHFVPCRPTPTRSAGSASTPRTCSGSGTGSADATRCPPRSGCLS